MRIKILILLLIFNLTKSYAVGIKLLSPVDGYVSSTFSPTFSWNPILNSTSYRLVIAKDPNFNLVIKDTLINQTTVRVNLNTNTTTVYWKVTTNQNSYTFSPIYSLNFISPIQSSNILLWLSADSNVTTQPDNSIDSWNNIIPNGLFATQSIGTSKPKLINNVAGLANNKAVSFDGVDDFLQINSGGLVGNTYILLNWNGGGSTFPTYNGILTRQVVTTNYTYFFTAFGGTPLIANSNGNYYNGSIYMNDSLNNVFTPFDKYKVLSGRKIGSIDNVSNFTIGRDPDGGSGRSWNGNIAEIIISKINSVTESDSIHSYLYNKYAPPLTMNDIKAGISFCDTIAINAPNYFKKYTWSNGSSLNNTNVTPNNKYSLNVVDIFGRESSTSFNVYPYRRLDNITTYICPGDTFKLDLQTPAGFTALWNTGLNNTKINIAQTGQYTVKVTDTRGCFVYDTINVVVDKPNLSPLPIGNNLNICYNQKLFLNTASSFDSIFWSTGSENPFITIIDSGNYTVYGKTAAGCIINQSFNINITGRAPIANFGYTNICQNTNVQFTDSSITNGGYITNWNWTFGDGNSVTTKNASNTYLNLGKYNVGFKITTNQGCSDSISQQITVNKKPIASFYNLLSCSGIPTTFVDQTIPNSAAVTDWSWNFGSLGTVDHLQNTGFVFPTPGVYNVTLKATNSNGCTDTITQQTTVNTSPVANFSFDSACGLTPVTFKFLATVPPPNSIPDVNWGNWDFGDGTIETAIRNPQHVYAAPGAYVVKLIVNSTGQCVDTSTKTVKVFNYPNVDFTVSPTQCTGKQIQFTDISTTPDGSSMANWNWYFSGQATDTVRNPRYTFYTAGNYTIQLTAQNIVGCSGTKMRSIAVTAPPSPKFTFTPQYGMPPLNVNFTNQSAVSGNYIWNYGDGSPVVAAYNPPQHIYNTKGSYPIQLIATDFRGCTDTLTKYILVDKAYVDGAMAAIGITPDGDYYKIQATVINNSNIEITSMGLSLQLGSGAVIRENWTGSLMPGQTIVYVFTGEIKVGDNGQIPVVCASIDNINNNIPEDRTDNNTTCKEVAVGSFSILNIYPNPANDNINFGVMLPKDGKVNIRFVDVLGQFLYNKDFDGTKGYNQLTMPIYTLNAAVYVAEVTYDGEVARHKFMVKNKK